MLVHAGAEKNVCNTVVSTDTHQTTTNFEGSACAIAVVVTLRSSSFEYTMSVHAVRARAERTVCNIY